MWDIIPVWWDVTPMWDKTFMVVVIIIYLIKKIDI